MDTAGPPKEPGLRIRDDIMTGLGVDGRNVSRPGHKHRQIIDAGLACVGFVLRHRSCKYHEVVRIRYDV